MSSPIRIVTIGGGSGQYVLLTGLRDLPEVEVTSVVSMVDSGGSTGRLRGEFGILPPGDLLKCVLALSPHQEIVPSILLRRFAKTPRLQGHNAGNLLLTMLSRYTGSFTAGIQALCEILDVRGSILPVTVDEATLVAELTDGTRIFGESAIDVPRGNPREKIRDVFLVPHHSGSVRVHPPVLDAVDAADLLVLGPGDLFTSLLPNLVVPGVAEALRRARAPLVYILNIMTKYGETNGFAARQFVEELESAMGRPVDAVIANTGEPAPEVVARYRDQKAEVVRVDPAEPAWRDRRLVPADLLDDSGGALRHHPGRLAGLVRSLAEDLPGRRPA